jgi:hypothetical protein
MSDPKVEYRFSPPAPATVVTMTGEALASQLAQARAKEREACCKDVCFMCGKDIPVLALGMEFHHRYSNELHVCFALAIRQRAAKEQAR